MEQYICSCGITTPTVKKNGSGKPFCPYCEEEKEWVSLDKIKSSPEDLRYYRNMKIQIFLYTVILLILTYLLVFETTLIF
jgi:hypothetical protein